MPSAGWSSFSVWKASLHTGTRKAHAAKYGFKRENPNVGWRVRNITPDTQRRKALCQDSLSLHTYTYLMFASITDIQPDQLLTAVWLRGKEYPRSQSPPRAHATRPKPHTRVTSRQVTLCGCDEHQCQIRCPILCGCNHHKINTRHIHYTASKRLKPLTPKRRS
jgi:hypothetical protein